MRFLPKNFVKIFYYSRYKCRCHSRHLTLDQILLHKDSSLEDFMKKFLKVEERNTSKKMKCDAVRLVRRENEREINDLLSLADTIREEAA